MKTTAGNTKNEYIQKQANKGFSDAKLKIAKLNRQSGSFAAAVALYQSIIRQNDCYIDEARYELGLHHMGAWGKETGYQPSLKQVNKAIQYFEAIPPTSRFYSDAQSPSKLRKLYTEKIRLSDTRGSRIAVEKRIDQKRAAKAKKEINKHSSKRPRYDKKISQNNEIYLEEARQILLDCVGEEDEWPIKATKTAWQVYKITRSFYDANFLGVETGFSVITHKQCLEIFQKLLQIRNIPDSYNMPDSVRYQLNYHCFYLLIEAARETDNVDLLEQAIQQGDTIINCKQLSQQIKDKQKFRDISSNRLNLTRIKSNLEISTAPKWYLANHRFLTVIMLPLIPLVAAVYFVHWSVVKLKNVFKSGITHELNTKITCYSDRLKTKQAGRTYGNFTEELGFKLEGNLNRGASTSSSSPKKVRRWNLPFFNRNKQQQPTERTTLLHHSSSKCVLF